MMRKAPAPGTQQERQGQGDQPDHLPVGQGQPPGRTPGGRRQGQQSGANLADRDPAGQQSRYQRQVTQAGRGRGDCWSGNGKNGIGQAFKAARQQQSEAETGQAQRQDEADQRTDDAQQQAVMVAAAFQPQAQRDRGQQPDQGVDRHEAGSEAAGIVEFLQQIRQ